MSKERHVRHGNAGPLALQMGDVTGAVDDLVHGYEQLVHTLPDLTDKIMDVYADTEQMAKQLEHRTRSMVDGYEYLQGLSTQLPEMFRETAEQHRKTLQGAICSLSPDELATIKENEEKLARIKLEMQSMCHERIVVDVLTRPLIRETKLLAEAAKQATAKEQQDRYTRALTQTSAKVPVNNTTANRVFNRNVTRAERASTAPRQPAHTTHTMHGAYTTPHSHITTNTTADHTVVVTNNRNPSIGDIYVSYKDTADQLSTPIYIPPYDPNRPRPPPAAPQRPSHEHELGGYLRFNNATNYFGAEVVQQGGVERLVARAVGEAKMVPNMRRGSLPPELANIHTDPYAAVTAADHLQTTKKRVVKRTVQFVEKETIARSLVGKLKQTDEEIADIKKRLSAAHNKFSKDQSAAMAKLQAIILELKEGMNGRDEALLKAVEALLREYMQKHKAQPAVNHDAAILKALEALLTPPPPVIDRLHEYKVLTVRPKVPVPVRTVPVVVPVPAPERVEVSVEVQTEPEPVVAPVVVPAPIPEPVVVPPPVVPVVAQPQQIVVNVPVQNTVERELIELMHNVVSTQHATMQGNQALILSLIHERAPQTIIQEVVTEPPPSPTPIQVPTPPAPLPTPIQAPPAPLPLPRYSTAFGEVVLGARSLTDAYTTPPTLIPTDHKPCVLRGIPPPEVRPVQPPRRVEERKDILVDGDLVPAHEAQEGGDMPTAGTSSVEGDAVAIDTSSVVGGGNRAGGGDDAPDVAAENVDTIGIAATVTIDTAVESIANTNTSTNANASATTTEHTIPVMAPNLGLSLAGTSSTSGRGGSVMHTTPGTELHMPSSRIPPYMRRKASQFTIRAIMGTTMSGVSTGAGSSGSGSGGVGGDRIGVNSNTTMYKNSTGFNAAADAHVANTTTPYRNTHTNTTNNNTTTTNTITAPTSTTTTTTTTANMLLTPEALAQHISEGVQRGVHEALGLMDTHSRHRTYYNTHPSANDTLHNTHASNGNNYNTSSSDAYHTNRDSKHIKHVSYNANNAIQTPYNATDYDQRGLLSTHTNTDIRHSLTLLKNRRSRSKRDSGLNAGIRSTHYSNHPHYTNRTDSSNYNTNYIEHNHTANRDVCQPPRRQAIAAQQRKTEHNSIMQDIMYSNANAHNMCNECDSIDDSVSLDETTAAYLRDPLMYNANTDNVYGDSGSVMSSLEYDAVNGVSGGVGRGIVRLVQKDVHTQRHSELFNSTDNVPVKAHTTRKHTTTTNNTSTNMTDNNTFVPLVSRVLQQSATEDMLYNQLTRQHHTTSTSVNSTSSVDNDRDQDDHMWDLTASAPMITFNNTSAKHNKHSVHTAHTTQATQDVNASTSTTNTNPAPTKIAKYSAHADGTLANMQLLRPKQYNQNEVRASGDSDSFVSIGSGSEHSTTRSILTHSTNSTDVSVNDSNIHEPIAYTDNTTRGTAAHTNNTNITDANNVYTRTSTTDINRANLAALSMNTSVSNSVNNSVSTSTSSDSGRRASKLPRYSPTKYAHNSQSHTHTHTHPTTHTNANTDNTELLAAQMMLNVLELHRPSNYTTTPYLSNPITSHLKRNGYPTTVCSKIYATESVDSASSASVTEHRYTNNRYFSATDDVDSDLDCTGSSISSAPDELLDHGVHSNLNNYSDTRSKPMSGLTLMGIGSNKLLKVSRK